MASSSSSRNSTSPRFSIWSRPSSSYSNIPPSPDPYQQQYPRESVSTNTMPTAFREFMTTPRLRTSSMSNGFEFSASPPSSFRPTLKRQGSSDTGVFNSLKGRLKKRPSAPLLSLRPPIPEFDEQITPTAKTNPWPSIDSLAVEFWSAPHSADDTRGKWTQKKVETGQEEEGVGISAESGTQSPQRGNASTFEELTWFTEKINMKVHPYPRSKAPYMQAYNRVLLDNDRYTDALLKRLSDTGGPAFHDYGAQSPSTVLDLGCGQGTWVIEAAMAWPNSSIVGFDLVDVEKDTDVPGNITWKRGNFVDGPLPFESETFDFIRMANLTLSIPQERWEHIFTEIKRVLRVGGRLELIDDEMVFPYSAEATRKELFSSSPDNRDPVIASSSPVTSDKSDRRRSTRSETGSFLSRTSSEGQSSFDAGDRSSEETVPSLSSSVSDTPASSYDDLLTPVAPQRPLPPIPTLVTEVGEELTAKLPTMHESESHLTLSSSVSTISSSSSSSRRPSFVASKELETVFQSMLQSSFGIHTRPHMFFLEILEKVFGDDSGARKIRSMHLALPPKGFRYAEISADSVTPREKPREGRRWGRDRDSKEKAKEKELLEKEKERVERLTDDTLALAQSEGKINAKAAKLLGVALQKTGSRSSNEDHSDFIDSEGLDLVSSLNASAESSSTNLPIQYPSHLEFVPAPTSLSSASLQPQEVKSTSQPPGLLLFPDTLLTIPSSELYMHVTKHMHVLLGCKAALRDYTNSIAGVDGKDESVDQAQWEELLWEYECSRHKRLGLPELFDLDDDALMEDELPASTPSAPGLSIRSFSSNNVRDREQKQLQQRNRKSFSSKVTYLGSPGTNVRTIRVFEATKTSGAQH